MAKQISKWIAADGTEWNTKAEAHHHEEVRNLEKVILTHLEKRGLNPHGRVDDGDVAEWLLSDADIVAKLAKFHGIGT